jgi:DNA repair protein RecN (Recombination protein N)
MLSQIHIRNFAIVDRIDVELDAGMTALTGETGAGKSILVDALGLVLGDRADSGVIRHGSERAEISASFETAGNSAVTAWLAERELDQDGECQLRRVINRGGRTRGYINGQPVPMQSLRELGEMLVDIHGQHEHQSLLRGTRQRQLLDDFGDHQDLAATVASLHGEWLAVHTELEAVISDNTERVARLDLLRYQLQELDALAMTAADIRDIDEEHARQANAGRLLEAAQQGLARLDAEDGGSASSQISRTLDALSELMALDSRLAESTRLLDEASILLQEGIDSLRHYADRLEIDPARLQWLEERIGLLHDLARKHRCSPEELPAIRETIAGELDGITHADEHREALQARLQKLEDRYQEAAAGLSGKRSKAAVKFGREITRAMQALGMAGGRF